jgi:hypothetical protein
MKELILRTLAIGAGATLVMDAWAALLRRFGIPSLNFAFLGRWIGHLPQLVHTSIARTPPIRGERLLGWVAHYSIGITFAALLVATSGATPTFLACLGIGLVTVVAPLFILQPALGAGIASSKTPRPVFNTVKSVVTHIVFGVGLYLAARVIA